MHLFRIRRLQTNTQWRISTSTHSVSVQTCAALELRDAYSSLTLNPTCDLGSGVCSDDQWEQQDHRMGACLLSGLWPGESGGGGSVGQRRAQSVSLICLFATMTPHSTVLRRAVMCYYPPTPAPPSIAVPPTHGSPKPLLELLLALRPATTL